MAEFNEKDGLELSLPSALSVPLACRCEELAVFVEDDEVDDMDDGVYEEEAAAAESLS